MFLTPEKKIWLIMGLLIVVVFLVLTTPFFVVSGFLTFSREMTQAVLVVLEFLAAAYLLNQFNRIRIAINKQKLENKKLSEIEKDIKNLSN